MAVPANVIKLSAAEGFFLEIPVLYEDPDLLVLDKPAGLSLTPDPSRTEEPSLISLLHEGIAAAKPWAVQRDLAWVQNVHRLDASVSGTLLLARNQEVYAHLANQFGSGKPLLRYLAIVQGVPTQDQFEADIKIGPHQLRPGSFQAHPTQGKRARTSFAVVERFTRWTLLACETWTDQPHQVRVHLRYQRLSVAGDGRYHGRPLLLSSLKHDYHLKPGKTERPLLSTPALHAQQIRFVHPRTGLEMTVEAALPKDIVVAIKYLRRYASTAGHTESTPEDLVS